MTITIWILIILALLVCEFITMRLYGACGAVGALAGVIVKIIGYDWYIQIPAAIVVTVMLLILVRPLGMKHVARIHRENQLQSLVGSDAIVISQINNQQGVGIVSINGKQWSARSHRPNAVIKAGEVVKVVAMNRDVAIVDDRKRNRR